MSDEDVGIAAKIREFLQKMGKPMSQKKIETALKLDATQIGRATNLLLQSSTIDLKQKNGKIYFAYLDISLQERSKKKRELSFEESIVYQTIEEEGNKGISARDISNRVKGSISAGPTKLPKILSALEAKGLIKFVHPLEGKTKKIYMLAELQPNKKLFGGVFFNTETKELDTVFIETLVEHCVKIITDKGLATTRDICAQLNQISVEKLEIDEVQQVIDILLYDNRIEEVTRREVSRSASTVSSYKMSRFPLPNTYFGEIPCTRCPVSHICSDTGEITPTNCTYLAKWLQF